MPQISLYIDEDTIKELKNAAKMQHISLSKWVCTAIKMLLKESDLPEGYFELFGSIKDDSFKKPVSLKYKYDARREEI